MLTINDTPHPDASASRAIALLNDAPETVLILAFPATDHAALAALLADATAIVDTQEDTITRYLPSICYEIADMDGRTYAKLRLSDWSETDNPDHYKAQAVATEQRYTDAELSRIAAEQAQTDAELQLLEVSQ